jgi:hypothetical protein
MPFGRVFKRTWRLISDIMMEKTIAKFAEWKLVDFRSGSNAAEPVEPDGAVCPLLIR